jgi:Right handed beta helix region
MTFAVATLVFEVQSGGNNANGGGFDPGVTSPGTDYSQQASPQVAYTDLVIDAVDSTKLTSAAHHFDSTSPGNCINITGGTGFTTGFYRILSVSGNTATMDRSVGSTGSTGGQGNLGGAWATPGFALQKMTIGGMTTYVKGATYQITSNLTSPTTANGTSVYRMIGYTSTRGDNGQATIQLNANNIQIITWAVTDTSAWSFENITFDGNNKTNVDGVTLPSNHPALHSFINCVFKNFTNLYALEMTQGGVNVIGCEFSNNAFTFGRAGCILCLPSNMGYLNVTDSYFANNSVTSTNSAGAIVAYSSSAGVLCTVNISRNIIYNNTGTNFNGLMFSNNSAGNVENNIIHSNTLDGINIVSTYQAPNLSITNNIITDNGGWGINAPFSSSVTLVGVNHNAYYNNTSGAKTGFTAGAGEVTLSGLPYVSAPTNFALNNTSGQGAACRAAAIPGTIGISSVVGTGYLDIGPLQHQDPATATGYAYAFA